jgi:hypothetical protein
MITLPLIEQVEYQNHLLLRGGSAPSGIYSVGSVFCKSSHHHGSDSKRNFSNNSMRVGVEGKMAISLKLANTTKKRRHSKEVPEIERQLHLINLTTKALSQTCGYVQDATQGYWTGVLTESWEVMMLASTHNTRGTINDTRINYHLMKTTWSLFRLLPEISGSCQLELIILTDLLILKDLFRR